MHDRVELLGTPVGCRMVPLFMGETLLFEKVDEALFSDCLLPALELVEEVLGGSAGLKVHE